MFTVQISVECSIAYDLFFYSDMERLKRYSLVALHLSPVTGILNENPV